MDRTTAEEVLVSTRLAGDKVGATKLDRPEEVVVGWRLDGAAIGR